MMQTYRCAACAGVLYLDNLSCGCGQQIALDPARDALVPVDARCANREVIGCNWTGSPTAAGLCHACAMTAVHPVTVVDENRTLWARAEAPHPPRVARRGSLAERYRTIIYHFRHEITQALAINHATRCLDIPDLYRFVLTGTVRDKLSFIHYWLRQPLRAAQGEPA